MADRILGGRYRVQDKIGIGGMATVYRGIDQVLSRTVAIKTMLPQYASDPSFAARFKQEAQAAAALQSPYIVGIFDWGKDGDTYYIVMEYLRGTDLKTGIRTHGALQPRKVAQIGSQICQALSVAHKHDIIHRDIKPQNIMVQPDGNIKVMDFGIARAKNSHLTADNSVLGTAHYVSPEQTQGKALGPTSDLYSLGIVMYEAATGKVPFDGDDAISVALKQVNEQPVPPSQVNPKVDPNLEAIIMKCLMKDPAQRYQSADELRRALTDYLAGRMVNTSTHMMPVAGGQTQVTPPLPADKTRAGAISASTTSNVDTSDDDGGSHRGRTVAIVLGVIAVIALAAWAFYSLTNGDGTRQVPNFVSLSEQQATSQIEGSDFFTLGDVTEEYSDTVAEGVVISQDPAAGTSQEKDTEINLVVSKGKKPADEVQVPDLKNMTAPEAEAALKKVQLNGQAGDSVYSSDVENGRVAEQDKAAGSTAKAGDTVVYRLSKGTENVDVPDVDGYSRSEATRALENAGFNVTVGTSQYSSTVGEGAVISHTPSGSQPKGTTINLTVSLGPKPQETTPSQGGNQGSGNQGSGNQTGNQGSGNQGSGTGTNPGTGTGTGTGTGEGGSDTGTGTGTGEGDSGTSTQGE